MANWLTLRRSARQFADSQSSTESRFNAEQLERVRNQQRSSIVEVLHVSTLWMPNLTSICAQMAQVANAPHESESLTKVVSIAEFYSNVLTLTADFDRALITADLLATDVETRRCLEAIGEAFLECVTLADVLDSDSKAIANKVRQMIESITKLGQAVSDLRGRAVELYRPPAPQLPTPPLRSSQHQSDAAPTRQTGPQPTAG
ncbi:hypothetical protein [Rhodococcus maanshanensis]|uniref:hypothetical protein n=1 Tax=Rhodococcus maanshanensis TaxID=183556 RepID=UPI0011607536|nr:hypothetical protein [Rhodococcus maanshanensis]